MCYIFCLSPLESYSIILALILQILMNVLGILTLLRLDHYIFTKHQLPSYTVSCTRRTVSPLWGNYYLTFLHTVLSGTSRGYVSQLSVWHSVFLKVMGSNPETGILTGMFSWVFFIHQAVTMIVVSNKNQQNAHFLH
jgi:hypothetical protein